MLFKIVFLLFAFCSFSLFAKNEIHLDQNYELLKNSYSCPESYHFSKLSNGIVFALETKDGQDKTYILSKENKAKFKAKGFTMKLPKSSGKVFSPYIHNGQIRLSVRTYGDAVLFAPKGALKPTYCHYFL